MKKAIFFLAVMSFIFSLSSQEAIAAGSKTDSPFLIVGKLPHATGLLMRNWDNPALRLSAAQKTKLVVVRKETMAGVGALKAKIGPLEKQIVTETLAGKSPAELRALVTTLAGLKADATMVHLNCVYDTNQILHKEQQLTLSQF